MEDGAPPPPLPKPPCEASAQHPLAPKASPVKSAMFKRNQQIPRDGN